MVINCYYISVKFNRAQCKTRLNFSKTSQTKFRPKRVNLKIRKKKQSVKGGEAHESPETRAEDVICLAAILLSFSYFSCPLVWSLQTEDSLVPNRITQPTARCPDAVACNDVTRTPVTSPSQRRLRRIFGAGSGDVTLRCAQIILKPQTRRSWQLRQPRPGFAEFLLSIEIYARKKSDWTLSKTVSEGVLFYFIL